MRHGCRPGLQIGNGLGRDASLSQYSTWHGDSIMMRVRRSVCWLAGKNAAVMEKAYRDMGNSIRERHKARKGDFVLFADDDNWYVLLSSFLFSTQIRMTTGDQNLLLGTFPASTWREYSSPQSP